MECNDRIPGLISFLIINLSVFTSFSPCFLLVYQYVQVDCHWRQNSKLQGKLQQNSLTRLHSRFTKYSTHFSVGVRQLTGKF